MRQEKVELVVVISFSNEIKINLMVSSWVLTLLASYFGR